MNKHDRDLQFKMNYRSYQQLKMSYWWAIYSSF